MSPFLIWFAIALQAVIPGDPSDQVEYGPKYRLGAAYVGYNGYQVGLNSQRISHAVQDKAVLQFVADSNINAHFQFSTSQFLGTFSIKLTIRLPYGKIR